MASRCVLGAVGDIALFGDLVDRIRARGAGWPLGAMAQILARADVLFGNLECVVLPPDYPDRFVRTGTLATRVDVAAVLGSVPFHFVSLANNHILDGGEEAMFYTRDLLEAAGIATGGVGRDQADARKLRVVEHDGFRIGFLCYAEDSNYVLSKAGPSHAYCEPEAVLEDVRSNRDAVDALVVSIHADLEFMDTPSVPRLALSRAIAEAGARVVLQHHPHVPQGIERWNGSLIAYSLGNFCLPVFTTPYIASHLPGTAISQVLLIELDRSKVIDFQRIPCEIRRPPDHRPVPVEGKRRAELEAYLAERDRLLQDAAAVERCWAETALQRLEASRRELAQAEDPEAALRVLGQLLFVAENRGWVEEIHRLAAARWGATRVSSSRYLRPSDVGQTARDERRSLLDRGIELLERVLDRMRRLRRRARR